MWHLRSTRKYPIALSIPETIEVERQEKLIHRDADGKAEIVTERIMTKQTRANSVILDPWVPTEGILGELELTDDQYDSLMDQPLFQAWVSPPKPGDDFAGTIVARRISVDKSDDVKHAVQSKSDAGDDNDESDDKQESSSPQGRRRGRPSNK